MDVRMDEADLAIVERREDVDLSVVIAVRDPDRAAPMAALYADYTEQFDQVGLTYEFIFVIEGDQPVVIDALRALKEEGAPITILVFARWYGNATALSAGFDYAAGQFVITLPAYHQIDPTAIPGVVAAIDDHDVVVARRWPRRDGAFTRMQVRVFHAVLRGLLGVEFNDLGSGVRLFRKEVLKTVQIYGDQHRFLPVLADYYGFKVKEVDAPQTSQDTFQKHLSAGSYVNRVLDLFSIFFLTRFTKKPLRFFGATGLGIFGAGFILTAYLTVQRLFLEVPLADKPLLLLGVLLIVLGALFFAIGLIGEMIIFTNADEVQEYAVKEIID